MWSIGRVLRCEVNVWLVVLCFGVLWYRAKQLRRLLYSLVQQRALRTTPCTVYPLLVYEALNEADESPFDRPGTEGNLESMVCNASLPPYIYPSSAVRPYRLWQVPFKLLLCVNASAKLSSQEVCQLSATATHTVYNCVRRLRYWHSASSLWYWQLLGQAKICVRVPSTEALLALHRQVVDAGILSFVVGTPKPSADRGRPADVEYCVMTVGPAPAADVDKLCRRLKLL